MRKSVLLLLLMLSLSSATSAQTKISGISQCGKPDPQHMVPVGDRPDHVFGVSKFKCTWTKPLDIEGIQTKQDDITGFSEVTGNSATDRSYVVATMSNGDSLFARPQGKSILKNGVLQSAAGTWTYVRGTGKLKGIQGKGTYKCRSNPDGTSTCDIEGEYQFSK
jgi:hypothetical protein